MTVQQNLSRFLNNRIFQHFLFWGFFFSMEFARYFEGREEIDALIYFSKFLIRISGVAIAVYVNLHVFLPYLLNKGKNALYFITVPIFILLISYPGSYIIKEFYDKSVMLYDRGPEFRDAHYFASVMLTTFLVSITSLIHLTKEWVKLKDVKIELEELARINLEAELKALKAQINPHFLFNTLNNIYALSLHKSEDTSGAILKLSDLMSYMIYDSSEELVEIKNEIEFLENYIALEKIRLDDNVAVEVSIDKSLLGIRVSPLLFISFIENAFKHCPKSGMPKPFIHLNMKAENNHLLFSIINSNEENTALIDTKHSGIGLENVKKRLALLYPNSHSLIIEDKKDIYSVQLSLDLSHA